VGTILNLIYLPATPFIGHPERAYIVSVLFGVLLAVSVARSGTLKPLIDLSLLLAALGWGLFGYFETLAIAGGANIRIDLLFGWPILCIITVAAIAAGGAACYCATGDERSPERS
jgi:hypothetical protein